MSVDWSRIREHELRPGTYHHKPGVRGFPDLPPGSESILKLDLSRANSLLDLSGSAGLAALHALHEGVDAVQVLESSAAALTCARLNVEDASAGLPWDALPDAVDTIVLQPPADRGTARVELEIHAAAARLQKSGRLLLFGHKDAGGKRYEKLAASLFRRTEVIRRDKGTRVLDCHDALPTDLPDREVTFRVLDLEVTAVKGTFAAGKLDAGTKVLLDALGDLAWLRGRKVLDLGCGYGLLAILAAAAGAQVTALDDDLAAVRSTQANTHALGLSAATEVLHSDLDANLAKNAEFDVVLMNPPFHVGRGVRLDVSRAFVDTACRRLRRGGEMWLVANRALPYESLLSGFRSFGQRLDQSGFKVLRAVR